MAAAPTRVARGSSTGKGCETERVAHTYRPPTPEILAWVARQIHPLGRVTGVARLFGGITADMDRIGVDSPAGRHDLVLRRWPQDESGAGALVRREVDALVAVGGHGIPVPRLVAFDHDGSQTGTRCTLTSVLPGEPDLAPADPRSWLDQLTTTQAAIHAIPTNRQHHSEESCDDEDPTSSPDRYGRRHRPLAWLTDHGLRAAAREAAAGPLGGETVLAHGDYQHFNVLWREGRLTGVVDWPHAAAGNRGSDVGHCRLNLAVLFGSVAAADYLVMYERAAGARVDRRADLRALLCFDLDWQKFIPRQVAGRAPLDVDGMPDRVAATIRAALDGID